MKKHEEAPIEASTAAETRALSKSEMAQALGLPVNEELPAELEGAADGVQDPTDDAGKATEALASTDAGDSEVQDDLGLDDDSGIPADLLGEAKEEESAEEEVEDPKGMNASQAQAFKTMRERMASAQKELKDLKAAAPENSEVGSEVVKTLQTELAGAKSKIAELDLREDADFKKTYDTPMRNNYARIQKMIAAFGGDTKLAAQALDMDVVTRQKLLTVEIPDAAPSVALMFNELDTIREGRQEALKNYEDTRKTLNLTRRQRSEEAVGISFDKALTDLREDKHVLLLESPSNEDWTKSVKARVDVAREFVASDDPNVRAATAIKAAMAEDYRSLFTSEQTKVKELKAKIAKLTGAKPKLGGKGKPKIAGKESKKKEPISTADMSTAVMQGVVARRSA